MRQGDESASAVAAVMENNVLAVRSEKAVARGGNESVDESREGGQESVLVEKKGEYAAVCKWTIAQFAKVKARALWSKYFEVGGYDCRLLVYPKGDSQALPGYISVYLQVTDPRGTSSSKWDCFASYRLCVVNQRDDPKTIQRDSWHRFSGKKKSHGWCDFTPSSAVLDPRAGFMVNEAVLITAEILILHESVSFSRENEPPSSIGPTGEVLSGKFTWKVHNLSLFKEMIKTQKIMSPVFPAGECNLRLSVYQSSVSGVDYLSMCLESKDTEKSAAPERSCWCLFRMSVLNQKTGGNHVHRDSYGRFAADNKSGDNTSLGWNDYMKMADFVSTEMGYLVDDTAVFSASFHVIKESSTFSKNLTPAGSRSNNTKKGDGYQGKFVWRIDNFTRLKDLLKKRKITGLCIKSRRFQVGNRDCRLIVYPRGQSQPPCHLSMFLEVTDPRCPSSDWSCFVSHRLSVVNQRSDERSVTKESQNRYSKAAKDWGWREFVTLTSLFDQDSGFLVQDTVVFSAEVLILKETSTLIEQPEINGIAGPSGQPASGPPAVMAPPGSAGLAGGDPAAARTGKRGVFTWRVENFVAFKEIMETRKIFSKFFPAGGVELRIGVYESLDTLCIYLESDQAMAANPVSPNTPAGNERDPNYWVRYRIGVVNQKHSERTLWKEASICTKTWNNSVLQFIKVAELLDPESGFLVRDAIVFVCEILDCCPWFEFSDLEENRGQALMSDEEQDGLSTDPDELLDSDESESNISGDEEDIFRSLLARAGFQLSYNDSPPLLLDPSQLQVTLREKLLMDAGAVAAFLAGLRVYLDDPAKVKRLLLPTQGMGALGGAGTQDASGSGAGDLESNSPSLMNLLMGVKVLQQAIVDLLLDIMVECCQPSDGRRSMDAGHAANEGNNGVKSRSSDAAVLNGPMGADARSSGATGIGPEFRQGGAVSSSMSSSGGQQGPPGLSSSGIQQRLDRGPHGGTEGQAVQSSDVSTSSSGTHAHGGDMWRPDVASTTTSQSSSAAAVGPVAAPEGEGQEGSAREVHSQAHKPKWPEQADELLGLIVDSLRTLDSAHLQGQGYLEPPLRRRPQSAQKIAVVLAHAPRNLQGALLGLVPRLVEPAEHPQAAQVLLDRLRQPQAEPSLRLPVLGALVQLVDMPAELWTEVLEETLAVLPLASDDALAAAVSFALKAASDCQQLPRAAKAVRARLQQLGPAVPPRVLHALRASVAIQADIATALLREIDADTEPCDAHFLASGMQIPVPSAALFEREGATEGAVAELQLAAQQAALACWRVADADVLVEMLCLPALRAEATAVFERAVARGAFGEQAIVMVLERRRAQRYAMEAHHSGAAARHPGHGSGSSLGPDAARGMANGGPGEVIQGLGPMGQGMAGPVASAVEPLVEEEDDFPAILGLAETLSLSEDVRVREFVGTLYAVMFKVYADEGYRERMLRGLVGRATSSAGGTPEGELGLDILAFLVQEEGVARPVLGLMREAAEVAVAERGAVWQQLRATEEQLRQARADRQADQQRLAKEKSTLQQKLSEAEASVARLKGELRLEGEKGAKERKESAERLRDMENQLEWARSEREEEVVRLAQDKKQLQERLREAEAQITQLKSRKRDELKKIMKEKNALAERLKNAENARKRFEEDSKRWNNDTVTREEVRQSLEAEVRRLTQTVGQTEGGLREKEEQVIRCEAYIDGMEAKLHAHQDYIQTLEQSLQEEMSRHAPLYGAGLDLLSLPELETLSRIHEEGLRHVRVLLQQRQQPAVESRAAAPQEPAVNRSAPIVGHYGQPPPPLAVGMPPVLANGVGVHANGHLNGGAQAWYPTA